MCMKAFGFRHIYYRFPNIPESFLRQLLKRDLFYKTIHTYTAIRFCITVSWQCMVGTAGIIPYTFGRIMTDENRTRIDHFFRDHIRIVTGHSIRCSGAYSFKRSIASSSVFTNMILLLARALKQYPFSVISQPVCRSLPCMIVSDQKLTPAIPGYRFHVLPAKEDRQQ